MRVLVRHLTANGSAYAINTCGMRLLCVSGPKWPGKRSRRVLKLTLGISSPCVSRRTLSFLLAIPNASSRV
eukprot:15005344-Heterocapsa_arctica.AAC.1